MVDCGETFWELYVGKYHTKVKVYHVDAMKMAGEMIASKEQLERDQKVFFFLGVFVCVHFSQRFFNVFLMSSH